MRSRKSVGFSVGDSAVGASEKFISSDSTVGSCDAALAFRVAEQVDIDAVLAAFEIQIDQRAGAAAAAGAGGKQRFVRADLLAHNDNLVPLAGRRAAPGGFQAL